MKLLLFLLTTGALVLWIGLTPAQAEDFILSFEPPALPEPPPPPPPPPEPTPPPVAPEHRPLPIPAHGTRPPMRFHSPGQLPSGVNRQAVAVALNEGHSAMDVLPPVPPRIEPDPVVAEAPTPDAIPPDAVAAVPPEPAAKTDEGILSFGVDSPADDLATVAAAEPEPAPAAAPPAPVLSTLFEGGNQSLVARAVGSAEGTRTAAGGFTSAYQGHTDPGNQVWNMGTFSYQHGAASAEEADRKQLKRLQSQTEVLERRALNRGMSLTLEETLNGIDLANQSPLASIGRVGYIERLAEVKTWGLAGTEAIVVARTRSYINPNTGRWNAPGLGNTEVSITRDQRRRTDAIARALDAYRLEFPDLNLSPTLVTIAPEAVLAAAQPPAPPPEPEPEPDTLPVQFSLDDGKPPEKPAPTLATTSLADPAPAEPTPSSPATAAPAPPDPEPADAVTAVPAAPELVEVKPSAPTSANAEPSEAESPDTEPSDPEPSGPESPNAEPSEAEASDTEPSDPESSNAESPDTKPSDAEPSGTESPNGEPSDPESSNAESSDAEPSEAEAPDTEPSEAEAPAALTN